MNIMGSINDDGNDRVARLKEDRIVEDDDDDCDNSGYDKCRAPVDEDQGSDTPVPRRYPHRQQRNPCTLYMYVSFRKIQVTNSDEPSLGEELNSTLEERNKWYSDILEEFDYLDFKEIWKLNDNLYIQPLPIHINLKSQARY